VATAFVSCSPSSSDRPLFLRIVANDSGYVMPARVPAGITDIHLVNLGTTTHEGVFTHFLTPDGNAAAYAESVRAGIDVPAFAEDVGGPGLAVPGDSTTIWMDLTPGHYAVVCWYEAHVKHGMIRDFDVVPSQSHASPPSTDLSVRMVDYSYQMDGTWSAGSHLVRIENMGTEAHEFDPYRLEPGKRPADFFYWIEHERTGPPPAIALGGSGTFVPGRRIWLPLRLTPGRYFAFCQMPAKVGGKSHYQMGMVKEFEVK
jgi:uncharacterized cupredoxin-like copper-binding protein